MPFYLTTPDYTFLNPKGGKFDYLQNQLKHLD